MFEIIPAILPTDADDLKKKILALPGEINYFHLDVLDLPAGGDIWTDFRQDFEAHLMVADPEAIIEKWVERGAKRLIVHKITDKILKYRGQVEIGLAFELDVPISDVLVIAELSDFVHVMSIAEIGAQGHPFDERIFDRIKAVQEKFPELPISVDGGITAENYRKLIDVGADRLVVGSHFKDVWNSLEKS